MAAAGAAGEGASVLLLEPRNVIGGAIAGGLVNTDIGTTSAVIGGRTAKFFELVGGYRFEPHVAEAVFTDSFLNNSSLIQVLLNTRIVSVTKTANTGVITSVTTANGTTYTAQVFVDCTYEGSLLPMADVSYTYGR